MPEPAADDRVGLCLECNYALHGLLENRCLDCGRAFDPDDPDTMNMGQPTGRRVRALLRLPTTRLIGVTIVASIAMLIAFVPPGSYVLPILPLLLVWIVVGLRWFVGCSLFYLIAWHVRHSEGAAERRNGYLLQPTVRRLARLDSHLLNISGGAWPRGYAFL